MNRKLIILNIYLRSYNGMLYDIIITALFMKYKIVRLKTTYLLGKIC